MHTEQIPQTAPLVDGPGRRDAARLAIAAQTRGDEPRLVAAMLEQVQRPDAVRQATQALALDLARGLRQRKPSVGRAGLVQGLLQEFALDSQEGIALMCLAEALLRIPDAATRDALIRDKIGPAQWETHLGQSASLFVNAATWGLLLTGRLVGSHSATGLGAALHTAVSRGGEPLVRKALDFGMRMMGEQFVTGQTIEDATRRAADGQARGYTYSYDILGEAALTDEEAQRYVQAYEHAIDVIGREASGRGIYEGPGISLKLSALHPRLSRAQSARVHRELYPRLLRLAQRARALDIGFNVDAEECARLDLTLDLLERLAMEPSLAGWDGLGTVVQCYQRRCLPVVDWLVDLARRSRRRLMIRLVKGAYWDAEIKRAQLDGLDGFPVFTRKPYADLAYLACARRLLAAPEQVYPQFATHNAHTLAAVHAMAGPGGHAQALEFQALHGMGEPLYDLVMDPASPTALGRPCRIYAPVGRHDALLAYLVRRLLENGSNSSFINRVANEAVALEDLVRDPVDVIGALAAAEGALGRPHPGIRAPGALFGARANSRGMDLSDESHLQALVQAHEEAARRTWQAEPLLAVPMPASTPAQPVLNPADRSDCVGEVREASPAEVEAALVQAQAFAREWAARPAHERAAALERAAARLDDECALLTALLAREAGKTAANGIAEVREAVDFLRYYAAQARASFDPVTHRPLGVVACISPWNFPLAIFLGQVSAALAAGNTVLAKPAEQTPLVAAHAVQVLWEAGIPRAALQLLPGRGEVVGAALAADARVQGVLFTGSNEVARLLQATLAGRLTADGQAVPLVAETGGQNAMVVDSSALPEQVVHDVLGSAFDSAGQRCSALRVLCVQRDIADRLLHGLLGAMRELRVGDPRRLAVDVGPVIDEPARAAIEAHLDAMRARGRPVWQPVPALEPGAAAGHFVAPTLVEIEHLGELQREVFGPVLHLLRFDRDDLDRLLKDIDDSGWGLTLGVHSRIDETVARVAGRVLAGNVYVNRNMVGAVVGSQPFGGRGLSGTGPKAGGPLAVLRLLAQRPGDAARAAVLASGPPARAPVRGLAVNGPPSPDAALQALQAWLQARGLQALADHCTVLAAHNPAGLWRELPGPTGEANLYTVQPRQRVLCEAGDDPDRLAQLVAVLAVGSRALWPAQARALHDALPAEVRARIDLHEQVDTQAFDVALVHGDAPARLALAARLASRPGPVVPLCALRSGDLQVPLERLVTERTLSVNTAAAGGNAALMALE